MTVDAAAPAAPEEIPPYWALEEPPADDGEAPAPEEEPWVPAAARWELPPGEVGGALLAGLNPEQARPSAPWTGRCSSSPVPGRARPGC